MRQYAMFSSLITNCSFLMLYAGQFVEMAISRIPIILSGNLADWIGIQRVLFLISPITLVVGLGDIPARLKNDFFKEVQRSEMVEQAQILSAKLTQIIGGMKCLL